jgi:acid phosphatase type 7
MNSRRLAAPSTILLAVLLSACPSPTPDGAGAPTATPQEVVTLLAAGDIAGCSWEGDEATAALIEERDGIVATLGDNVYPDGSDTTYAECYAPSWGGFLDRTRPALGNHDIRDDDGAAYFRYFGDTAGTPGEGWYSYDHGAWHVVVLNSNCKRVECGEDSAQVRWLVADLAASDARCTLAYWHHPRFSSGRHGDSRRIAPFWQALDEAGADLILAGHDHLYERFAPQASDGTADPNGLRQITVGTGGAGNYADERNPPNSELVIDDVHGILVLTLRPTSYDWSFVTTDGVEADAGSADCV